MALNKLEFFDSIGYKPHKHQWLYHNSAARFRVPVCGRRFGKSSMAGRDLEPELFHKRKWFWIVGPTYDLAEKEFRVIWDDLIIGKKLGQYKRVKKAYNKRQGNMYIEFPWRTRLECRSADTPESLIGEGLHGVIMSEAAKHKQDTWNRFIRPALADYKGWASFPTTPEGMNWLHKFWQFGQDPSHPAYESWRFPSWYNPYVYPNGYEDEEIQEMLRTLPKEEFEQEIGADFTAFTGRIYSEFQEDQHVINNYTFNPAWPNYMAFDFGYVNPFVCIEFQISPKDEVFVWREHYRKHLINDDHIALLKGREQPPGYHVDLAFGDAADPASVMDISTKLVPCMADPESKKDWREGIDLVKTFLKPRTSTLVVDEYGTPAPDSYGFYVTRDCTNMIREFNNYKAPSPTSGKNPRSPRETANSIDDHALDAIRYGLMHLYKLGARHRLDETVNLTNYESSQPVIETFDSIIEREFSSAGGVGASSMFTWDMEF